MNLPDKYVERMKVMLKNEFDDYIKSFDERRALGIRANTLKITAEELNNKKFIDLEPVTWCSDGFYYDSADRPSKHPYYHAGLYYLQEPSAMSPAAVMGVVPGDRVLDICAAPGGKSTHIGAKLNGKGVLVANDISAGRTKALLKNIELFGIKNAIITAEPPAKLAGRFAGYFDKILIDAPCSGEGMFRKEPDIIKSWGEEMSSFCCREQSDILENASLMLKEGGYLLYSTCTFAPEENEGAISRFLNEHKEFSICNLSEDFGFDCGHPEWVEDGCEDLKFCARLWPHKIKGEGHFLALLKKNGSNERVDNFKKSKCADESELKYFLEFKEKYLNIEFDGEYQIFGDNLYLMPVDVPDLKGIRVIRSGLHLGENKKNRFEPSQALAMGLKKSEAKYTIDFTLEDENVIRYLKGETIAIENKHEGWCLVTVDSYPLGWGKMQNGRLKNKYFPGWKWE